ncbi:hypothetical protein A2767_00235 [Candidatus Roizmanbacteria bacterium RIFCSPHIGHO2_01_FULL_35_10]|uniref:Uncharacterized protein n=1 Tax=Candidatus Roizmanbacteria bacterium RIFCSPLOWO2_01_FULL_35_13 TaxID=1802055 RepID=A0A1F7IHD6_9BACT|nr:MAG: hypothetical protein A2767_00235 [Candidatus Roizmanbacteria bacterium RIFCSPHIGHO2_01_FULL_35_10]OGK42777.1 MAG: hypothetical protein A3A74_01010 [Candidatus Roizmanbacteria bacterium RIFCSPLOWO2_01_FULL_35_13]
MIDKEFYFDFFEQSAYKSGVMHGLGDSLAKTVYSISKESYSPPEEANLKPGMSNSELALGIAAQAGYNRAYFNGRT